MIEKIRFILEKGAFAIPPKLNVFSKHIGKTEADVINDIKQIIDNMQNCIKDESKDPSHELEIYFEMLNELMLARDLKYLAEKFQEGLVNDATVQSTLSGYQDLIISFKKEEILKAVLQAADVNDIYELAGLLQATDSDNMSFNM